jgi:hypothetical protein
MAHPALAKALKLYGQLPRRFNQVEAFDAFLELSFCALAKLDPKADEARRNALEGRYMREVSRWPADDIRKVFPALLAECFENSPNMDYLGMLAGELGVLRAEQGQFFTPFEVCKLMAAMQCTDVPTLIKSNGYFTMAEPAVGAGAMVLALASNLRESGYDPSTVMFVDATDLSERAYRMAYVQLSVSGIAGRVTHGDSLSGSKIDVSYTMGYRQFVPHANACDRKRKAAEVTIRKRTRPTKPVITIRKRERPRA